MNKTSKFLLGSATALVLVGGCAAAVSGGSTPETTGKTTAASTAASADPNVVGSWKLLNREELKFEKDMFDEFAIVELHVKNISDQDDAPFLDIRLTNGTLLVTTFTCSGNTIRPGESAVLECFSIDPFQKFTKVEILNSF